jgi:predicted aspartyl protease
LRRFYGAQRNELRVEVLLSEPGSDPRYPAYALLDTGAEISIVPDKVREALQLPEVDKVELIFVDKPAGEQTVVQCTVAFEGGSAPIHPAVYGNEVILGMDWFNQVQTCYGFDAITSGWVLDIKL